MALLREEHAVSSSPLPAPSEMLGGRFQIEREVGRGAVGVVYRAYDCASSRYVALKLIAHRGNDDGDELRFEREGQVLAGLDHPNIVHVVAFGSLSDRTPYIAMEWLDGEDLSVRQRRAPLDVTEAVEVARQVALALGAAHRRGPAPAPCRPASRRCRRCG